MAGRSLADMCKNYGLDKDEKKKDIDITKVKTWAIAQDNMEEIIEYAKRDVSSMLKLYEKF